MFPSTKQQVIRNKLSPNESLPNQSSLQIEDIMELLEVCVRNTYFQGGCGYTIVYQTTISISGTYRQKKSTGISLQETFHNLKIKSLG
jgi:hypothetical protein